MASTTPARIPWELCSWSCYCMSPRRLQREHAVHGPLGSCARSLAAAVVQHQHDSLGSCVRGPATASTSSTMPARVHGPSGVVSSSCVVSPHANLKSTSPTTPAQVPLGGVTFVGLLLSSPHRLQRQHAVHGPSGVVLARRRRTTPARLPRESLGSCARSLPSYNTSTAPLGVAFVVLLQRPDGVFDVVSHACTCVKGDTFSVRRERWKRCVERALFFSQLVCPC